MPREVKGAEGATWVCAQAYAGLSRGGEAGEAAAAAADGDGRVEVVCTPSGGEQTVRLRLPQGWEEDCSDDELLRAIDAARRAQ